jgi:Fur family transcriptional regulator, ferric uptake regulator
MISGFTALMRAITLAKSSFEAERESRDQHCGTFQSHLQVTVLLSQAGPETGRLSFSQLVCIKLRPAEVRSAIIPLCLRLRASSHHLNFLQVSCGFVLTPRTHSINLREKAMVIYAANCDSLATGQKADSLGLERRPLLAELTSKGVRLTAQRRVLVEIIQNATAHLDAAALLKEARKREATIDRATVYRTIDLLKKFGLVDELDLMHLNGEKHYYEVKTRRDHLHLACFQCGRIQEFATPLFEELKSEISRRNGFQIQVVRLEVGGRCSSCRDSANSREARKEEARIRRA